jgi:hypothetical protein
MLDLDPDTEGKEGQIIGYIHDPDEVVYVAENLKDLIFSIIREIKDLERSCLWKKYKLHKSGYRNTKK